MRGEKEAFVASASSSLCVFPLHGLFKKKNACYTGYIQNCLGIYFCRTNDAKLRVPDPYGFEPLIDLNVFSSGVDF